METIEMDLASEEKGLSEHEDGLIYSLIFRLMSQLRPCFTSKQEQIGTLASY